MINCDMLPDDGCVWLTSRYLYNNSLDSGVKYSIFSLREIDSKGKVYGSRGLFAERENGDMFSYDRSHGVHPVVSLRTGLDVSGVGTISNPWVFGI